MAGKWNDTDDDGKSSDTQAALLHCSAQLEDALRSFIIKWKPRVGMARAVALAQTVTALLVASNIAKLTHDGEDGNVAEYFRLMEGSVREYLPGMRRALARAKADPEAMRRALGAVERDVAPLFVQLRPAGGEPN